MIVFVQPFGLHSPVGGARILRALLQDSPRPFLSVCAWPEPPPPTSLGEEIHVPLRAHFGRIEHTRFAGLLWRVQPLYVRRFERKLEQICSDRKATVIHSIPHGMGFWYAYRVARRLGLPYVLNVHDELDYNLRGRPDLAEAQRRLATVWCEADARIVISEQMGEEYCRRYGSRPWITVTDGLISVPETPIRRPTNSLRVYFMGALHLSYEANFRSLRRGLHQVGQTRPDWSTSLTLRGGTLPADEADFPVTELPWAAETEVAADMREADVLYLPLPFEEKHASFSRFSLSTKMVTYLGTGLPILYHGPGNAAAAETLAGSQAAIMATTLDPDVVAATLMNAPEHGWHTACNALALGRRQFLLESQRSRFWDCISAVT